MKLLLDSCLCRQAAEALRQCGHDVVWIGDLPRDPGDEAIFQMAIADARVLVTIDKDFGELATVQQIIHAGLIRLIGFRASDQGPALIKLIAAYETSLKAGAILTVEPWRVRVRLSDPADGLA